MTTETKIIKKQIEGIRLSLGSILLMLCCTFLIILATFVQLNVSHFIIPKGLFDGSDLAFKDFIYTYKFIPQIPIVMFGGAFLGRKFSNKNILKATIVGVLTIHLIGILYMLFIASIKHEGWSFISGWICAQSGIKIIYDLVFSFAGLFLARYAKIILWFFM